MHTSARDGELAFEPRAHIRTGDIGEALGHAIARMRRYLRRRRALKPLTREPDGSASSPPPAAPVTPGYGGAVPMETAVPEGNATAPQLVEIAIGHVSDR